MRRSSVISLVVSMFIVLGSSLYHSCTMVPLDGSEYLPDSVGVNLVLNWPQGIAESDKPENMCVAMSRIINTVHYVWQADSAGVVKDYGSSRDNMIPNGEYYMMIFNDISATYTIDAIDRFQSDPAVSMRELSAVVNDLPEDQIPSGVADFNPAFGYVNSADPLYIDVKKQRIYPTLTPDLAFDIKTLTQKLTFRVSLKLIGNVTIENDMINAEISGVPKRVQLMSALVRDSTYRALFEMKKASQNGNVYVYQGNVNVLGLFPSGSQSDVVGPGILQLTIPAITMSEDGTTQVKRLFHAGINLRETILGAVLMSQLADGSGYRAARSSAVLVVNSVLEIDEDQIRQDEDSQGVEVWFDSDDNDIDIEV